MSVLRPIFVQTNGERHALVSLKRARVWKSTGKFGHERWKLHVKIDAASPLINELTQHHLNRGQQFLLVRACLNTTMLGDKVIHDHAPAFQTTTINHMHCSRLELVDLTRRDISMSMTICRLRARLGKS